MKIVCITDVHGYLDEALNALRKVESKTNLDLLTNGQWDSEHRLIVNGDMFDRGRQNEKSLKWALDNSNIYNLGNHEFFALFPDISEDFLSQSYFESQSKDGLYWKNMSDEERHSLIKAVADGDITAAFKKHNYAYSHSGIRKSYPKISKMNTALQKVGKKLLETHEKAMKGDYNQFKQAQRKIVNTVETDHGRELKSKYPYLFNVQRNSSGEVTKGGIVWNRFQHLKTGEKQVVGHTRGEYLKNRGFEMNPQWKNQALNINTIRDAVNGQSKIAVTIEDKEGLEVYETETKN